MSVLWHYVQNGKSLGPVPEEQLRSMLAAGGLRPSDLVWREGMASWMAAQTVPELAPPSAPVMPFAPIPAAPYAPPHPVAIAPMAAPAPLASGVSPNCVEYLRKTKPWVRFMGVLGMIMIVLMLVGGLAMAVLGGGFFRYMGMAARIGTVALYLVVALLYLPPVIFLNRYASRIRDLVDDNTTGSLEEALRAQKSFWKYIGMFTLIGMCLYLLVLVGVLLTGVAMGAGKMF